MVNCQNERVCPIEVLLSFMATDETVWAGNWKSGTVVPLHSLDVNVEG